MDLRHMDLGMYKFYERKLLIIVWQRCLFNIDTGKYAHTYIVMPILKLRMKNAANYCATVWQMHLLFSAAMHYFFKHFDKMANHMTEICCKYFNENRCAT